MEIYAHLRTLFALVLGLSIGHSLRGVAQIVQHPARYRLRYWVHLVWAAFLLIYTIHFWWWEFALRNLIWNFPLYLFIALFGVMIFFLSLMLFPDGIGEYKDYADYFYSRKGWIYGLLTAIFAADLIDTWIKGSEYHARMGVLYDVRAYSLIVLCMAAIWIRSRVFHASLACYAIGGEIALIVTRYQRIG